MVGFSPTATDARIMEYTDNEYNYTFKFPSGWTEKEIVEQDEFAEIRVLLQGPRASSIMVLVNPLGKGRKISQRAQCALARACAPGLRVREVLDLIEDLLDLTFEAIGVVGHAVPAPSRVRGWGRGRHWSIATSARALRGVHVFSCVIRARDQSPAGVPQPPPPGVSTRIRSPGPTSSWARAPRSSLLPSARNTVLRPTSPSAPPSRPQGA